MIVVVFQNIFHLKIHYNNIFFRITIPYRIKMWELFCYEKIFFFEISSKFEEIITGL